MRSSLEQETPCFKVLLYFFFEKNKEISPVDLPSSFKQSYDVRYEGYLKTVIHLKDGWVFLIAVFTRV